VYGVLWAATGIDQTYPADYAPAQINYNTDVTFHGMQPPILNESQLAFDALEAGLRAARNTPVLLVNEPILISNGENSDLRYNFFYPRWAYDQYRLLMNEKAKAKGWNYIDLWNLLPADQFTNSAIHLTPAGESSMAEAVKQAILQQSCR
jgi:hypothetical protein